MGVYIPNMDKPKGCWDCFNYDCDHWGEHGYDNSTDCPLIEIEEWNSYGHGKMYAPKGTFQKILDGERRANESDT